MTYGDGGFYYNNPVRILMDESKRIWNYATGRRAGFILSVGTGKRLLNSVGNGLVEIIKSIEAIVTDTEETAEMFANEISDIPQVEKPDYFRFNVDQGLENIGLEEWKQFEMLAEASSAYLRAHRREIEVCADILSALTGKLQPLAYGVQYYIL
jgi:hypothetical protein